MLTIEELAAIEQRATEATDGPWFVESGGVYNAARSYLVVPVGESVQDYMDAAFVACARSDVPALLADVQELREVLQGLCAASDVTFGVLANDYAPGEAARRLLRKTSDAARAALGVSAGVTGKDAR